MTVRYSATKIQNAFDRLEATTGAMTLYVATTGDDNTGTGAVGSPYATVERAFQDLPRYIRHECKILVAAGVYASGWPTTIAPIFEEDGSLAIVGVGTPDVVSGPWTVTGVASLGSGGIRLTIAAGGLGATDSLCGQTVMILTGGHPGNAHQVVANTDTTIDILFNSDAPHNADTFNLVRPAVKMTAIGCDFRYDSRTQYGSGGAAWNNCRFVVHNIWLDASTSAVGMDLFKFGSVTEGYSGFWLDFVTFTGPGTAYGTVSLVDTNVGQWAPHTDAYILAGATGITNLSVYGKPGFTIDGGGDRVLADLYCRGRINLLDGVVKGALWLSDSILGLANCGAGSIGNYGGSALTFSYGTVVGKAGENAIDCEGTDLRLSDVHFLFGLSAIKSRRGSYISLTAVSCDATGITGSAADIGVLCRVRQSGALNSFLGATVARAAYRFTAPAADIDGAAWLAADGDTATDSRGAFITRGD